MRSTTAALRHGLAAAEAADERLAQSGEKIVSFLDKLERSLAQRRADLHQAIDATFEAMTAELMTLRAMKADEIVELRGLADRPPAVAPPPRSLPPVSFVDAE